MGLVAAGLPLVIRAEEDLRTRKDAAGKDVRPNIIFVLGDDMGIDSGIECYGSDRKGLTPHLDALAAGGLRFEHCYANTICGPTRCQFLTGRYAFRTGAWDNQAGCDAVFARDEYPVARILSEAGYDTCSVGKWRQMTETPREWGFGEYVMSPTPGGFYWTTNYTQNGLEIRKDQKVFFPDVCQDYALEFIRKHAAGGAAAGKPFFLYYPTHLMHDALQTPPGKKFDGKNYRENLIYLDKQMGELAAELDRLNLRDNTLIIFAGDNGSVKQDGILNGRRISGTKHTMLEGGALVPCIINWKGGGPGGRVVPDLVDFSDFLPTFVELAGAEMPRTLPCDGRSFAPLLRGQKGTPREWIFVGVDRKWYVRDAQWKLNESGELFDMKEAPFAEPLVPASAESEEAKAARKRLQAVLDTLNPASGKNKGRFRPKSKDGARPKEAAKPNREG